MTAKQLAVIKQRTWHQAHCNECDADVGGFYREWKFAAADARVHNELAHGVSAAPSIPGDAPVEGTER
jgi:hypothetical protein